MTAPARFRALSTITGLLGLFFLLLAITLKAIALLMFVLAALVFFAALGFSLMSVPAELARAGSIQALEINSV